MSPKSLPLHATADDIRAAMDAAYAEGDAYRTDTLVDARRHAVLFDRALGWLLREIDAYAFRDGRGQGPRLLLDIGCGVGEVLGHPELARWLQAGNRYLGLDVSQAALGHAHATAQRLGLEKQTRFALAEEGIEGLDISAFADDVGWRIDGVLGVETIEHWRDARAGLAVVAELLGPGAPVVFTTPNTTGLHGFFAEKLGVQPPLVSWDHVREFGFEELGELLRTSGFDLGPAFGAGMSMVWGLEDLLGSSFRLLNDHDADTVALMQRLADAVPELAFCQVRCAWKAGAGC